MLCVGITFFFKFIALCVSARVLFANKLHCKTRTVQGPVAPT